MRGLFIAGCFSSLLVQCAAFTALRAEWEAWKVTHGKTYAIDEADHRYGNWLASKAKVAAINSRNAGWEAALNDLSDLTWQEFQVARLMMPQNCSATHKSTGWKAPQRALLPNAVDWRMAGALSPVKNQGHCGSCWTFSSTGSMESHHFLKHGKMLNLSEQQLVDCAGAFDNHGCNGGLPSHAFEYLMYAGGQDTEEEYPYTAATGTACNYNGHPASRVTAVHNITAYGEDELLSAVGTAGPVSIAFQVSDDFRYYSKGVYDGVCETSPASVNHAVVAVGYGATDDEGTLYWIVRNSWGPAWGLDGYFLIRRGVNKCGLADCASFPEVE